MKVGKSDRFGFLRKTLHVFKMGEIGRFLVQNRHLNVSPNLSISLLMKMYLMTSIKKEERLLLKFLLCSKWGKWVKDENRGSIVSPHLFT